MGRVIESSESEAKVLSQSMNITNQDGRMVLGMLTIVSACCSFLHSHNRLREDLLLSRHLGGRVGYCELLATRKGSL